MKKIVVLGATGSVGSSVLDVLRKHPGEFSVVGLAARRTSEEIVRLAAEFPEAAVTISDEPDASFLQRLKAGGSRGGVTAGPEAAAEMMTHIDADMCVAAMSGTAGLPCAFIAAGRGIKVLLANKEVLVSAGDLFMSLAAKSGAEILPLDSEHAALWQCLEGHDISGVEKVTITASGGPFWKWSREKMAEAKPEDALKHPVWSMGAKISIDSATLANKALEVLEASCLFGIPEVEVLVHPQSVVHGMVEWRDGSMVAHMGVCDMRQPIGVMLCHPRPAAWMGGRVDLAQVGRLDFYPPDYERFPLLRLGLAAGKAGGVAPAYFNAANEETVGLFLNGSIGFGKMAGVVETVMKQVPEGKVEGVEHVLEAHDRARALTREAAGVASF